MRCIVSPVTAPRRVRPLPNPALFTQSSVARAYGTVRPLLSGGGVTVGIRTGAEEEGDTHGGASRGVVPPASDVVLVVDDSRPSGHLACMLLRRRGMPSAVALHGLQALRMGREMCPRAVLMDFEMPRWKGPALMPMLRELPGWQAVPFIAYTNSVDLDLPAAVGLGFAGLITKPVKEDAFHGELDRLNLMSRSPAFWVRT